MDMYMFMIFAIILFFVGLIVYFRNSPMAVGGLSALLIVFIFLKFI